MSSAQRSDIQLLNIFAYAHLLSHWWNRFLVCSARNKIRSPVLRQRWNSFRLMLRFRENWLLVGWACAKIISVHHEHYQSFPSLPPVTHFSVPLLPSLSRLCSLSPVLCTLSDVICSLSPILLSLSPNSTCCLYGVGRMDFDGGVIHNERPLKGWAL
jgi:hypothetical protein